jgi:hypothetical protein
LVAEEWFVRALSLERKRTERSRKPFVLALLNLHGVEVLNGDKNTYLHRVVSAISSFTRETDIIGWYCHGTVLGTIFTELGTGAPSASLSIASKLDAAIETHLGQEKSVRIDVTYHFVFPKTGMELVGRRGMRSFIQTSRPHRSEVGWVAPGNA